MREILTKQGDLIFARHIEGVNYVLGCIDAGICPICGRDLFTAIDKDDRKLTYLECLSCDWHDYV